MAVVAAMQVTHFVTVRQHSVVVVAVTEVATLAIVARRVAAARQVTRAQRPLAAEVAGEAAIAANQLVAVSQLAERAVPPRAERNQVTAHDVAIVVVLATLRSSLTHVL